MGKYYFRVTIDGIESNVGILTIDKGIPKSVSVGDQEGNLEAGIAGQVKFPVKTESINFSEEGTVQWYSNSAGTTKISAPSGITKTSVSTGTEKRSLLVETGISAVMGHYYFRVIIDSIESNVGILTINKGIPKSVSVGDQEGKLIIGVAGEVKFPVKTESIDFSETGTVRWFTNDNGNTSASEPSGISTSVSTGSANRTLTVNSTDPMKMQAGKYYFRVRINGVDSNVGTLIIGAPKTVLVGQQIGQMIAGVTNSRVEYTVNTTNIANGSYPITVDNRPGGVTVDAKLAINNNRGTLVLIGNERTKPGYSDNLVLTIDETQSNQFYLLIDEPDPVKTVTVGNQVGTLAEFDLGSVTFPVTTVSIDNTQTGDRKSVV
jgi:hypothetical protein